MATLDHAAISDAEPDPSRLVDDGWRTCGLWETEEASCAALDEIVERSGLFTIRREVRGYYLQPRLEQEVKTPRIDRILFPTPRLKDLGWAHGPIGIECKRSGCKTGPPLAQLFDYSRAAWDIAGTVVMPKFFFLWPMHKVHGPLASIMAQNRVGTAETGPWCPLKLSCGEQILLRIDPHGQPRIGIGAHGRKAGSR